MPRKQHIVLPATILMICLLYGCSSKDPDRYYSKKDDFSIKLPNDWEIREGFMGSSVISLSPQENSDDQFRENVNVVIEQKTSAMELDEYFSANITNMSKFFVDFRENEKGSTSINETNAKWLIYSGRMGTLSLKNKVYFMVHEKRGYAITCSATPDGFSRYKKSFDEIAQSFEFE